MDIKFFFLTKDEMFFVQNYSNFSRLRDYFNLFRNQLVYYLKQEYWRLIRTILPQGNIEEVPWAMFKTFDGGNRWRRKERNAAFDDQFFGDDYSNTTDGTGGSSSLQGTKIDG